LARWFSLSTQFATDPKLEALGEEHGPAGPLAAVVLMARAKVAADGGRVKFSRRTLANEVFIGREDVDAILKTAEDVDLIEIEESGVREITVRFPAFAKWQDAGRKSRDREMSGGVRRRPEASDSVPTDKQTNRQTDKQTKAAPEGAAQAAKKRKGPDPNQPPEDFPPHLLPALRSTYSILKRTAEAKGSNPVTALAVARAIEARPDRDHAKVASEVEHWCCFGRGENKQAKDIVARFRNFLDNADRVAVHQPRPQRLPS
jgi:hypothetical protein